MSNYRRNRIPGGTYFFTVNLLDRHSQRLIEHIGLLRQAVRTTKAIRPFHIDAWVVLPDHMHTVWTLPPGDADYSGRWRAIKKTFTKSLPGTEHLSAAQSAKRERGIWQRRFWEHTIRDDEDYTAHIDYVHINPVKHGHATRVRDWPFSSFHRAVAQGIYTADWGGETPNLEAGERVVSLA